MLSPGELEIVYCQMASSSGDTSYTNSCFDTLSGALFCTSKGKKNLTATLSSSLVAEKSCMSW